MAPVWRQIQKWRQDEGAQMHARMRQDGVGRRPDQAAHGDDIEVKRARGVDPGPDPAEAMLDSLERGQQDFRQNHAFQADHTVCIRGLPRRRHRRRLIPAGQANRPQTRHAVERGRGALAGLEGLDAFV